LRQATSWARFVLPAAAELLPAADALVELVFELAPQAARQSAETTIATGSKCRRRVRDLAISVNFLSDVDPASSTGGEE
jgi:hypothetical protein